MSRARRVFAAFRVGMANQALASFGSLWITRFALHRIGTHDFGLWVIAAQFLGYLTLLDLGVTGLLPRDVANVAGKPIEHAARDAELRDLVERTASLAFLLLPLLTLASIVLVALLPPEWAAIRRPVALSLVLFVILYPLGILPALLTGLQEQAFVARTQTAAWAATVAATVVLVWLGFGLNALVVAPYLGQVVQAVACLARLLSRHRAVVPRRLRWASRDVIRRHMAPGVWATIGKIAQLLLTATDVVVIGRILGPEGALRFSFTDKTENILGNQPFSIVLLAFPAIAELKGAGRKDDLLRILNALTAATLVLSGAIVLAVLETNHAFVRSWVGEGYFGGAALTVTILANMMARHWQFPYTAAIFNYFGRLRALSLMQVADGILSVALSVFLVHRIGIVGAPLGSLISVLLTQWPGSVILFARETGVSVWSTFAPVMPWALRFAPIAIVAWVAGVWLGGSSLVVVAAVGAVIGVVYVGAMLPFLRRPPLDVYANPYLAKIPFLR